MCAVTIGIIAAVAIGNHDGINSVSLDSEMLRRPLYCYVTRESSGLRSYYTRVRNIYLHLEYALVIHVRHLNS